MGQNDYPGVLGVGVRLTRQTLLSYDNVSLIPNYHVGSKLLSLNKHMGCTSKNTHILAATHFRVLNFAPHKK